jgi:hypothetical protein
MTHFAKVIDGKLYRWDEATLAWVEVTPPTGEA